MYHMIGPFDEEIIWLLTMLNLIEDGLSENHIQFVKIMIVALFLI